MHFQLADLWEALTDAGPDAECLVAGDVRHTRRLLDERANRFAHHLLAHGVDHGDHVGVYSYNRAEFLEAMFGCWKIGAVAVNVNYRYVADELRYLIDDADLVAMVAERTFVPLLDELVPEFPDLSVHLLLDDGADHEPSSFEATPYEEALAAESPGRDFGVERSPDDLYLLYTGGTTGMPKGVMWRHEDVFFACYGGGNYFDPITSPEQIAGNGTDPPAAIDPLALAPLMHGGGQWITFIGIYSGGKATVYTARHFDAHEVLRLIDRERPMTVAFVGDAMARPVAEAVLDPANRYDVSSLASVGNGGAMLTKAVRAQIQQGFPNAIITDSYGATETGAAGTQVEQEGYSEGPKFTVNADTTVLDDDLRPIEPGSGERGMLARSGHIPLGYYKDAEKTAATFRTDPDGRRWVIPGDLATLDDEGRVVLFGRGSQSINTGGEKVFPEEVEAVLRSHPDVYDALVCGVPDERWVERVVALVQLRDGVDALTLEDVQAHCREHIAGYKVPRDLVLGPVRRTNVGKPDYVWARQRAQEGLAT